MPSHHRAILAIGFDTRRCLASHRASSLDKEEQHCPSCDTRKNKFSNMARICKSRDGRYPMDCLGNQIWQSRGATTYLQVVSLYKVHMTDSMSLLPKIQISKKITCGFGQTVTHNYQRTLPHLYFVLLYHHHTRTSHHSI